MWHVGNFHFLTTIYRSKYNSIMPIDKLCLLLCTVDEKIVFFYFTSRFTFEMIKKKIFGCIWLFVIRTFHITLYCWFSLFISFKNLHIYIRIAVNFNENNKHNINYEHNRVRFSVQNFSIIMAVIEWVNILSLVIVVSCHFIIILQLRHWTLMTKIITKNIFLILKNL